MKSGAAGQGGAGGAGGVGGESRRVLVMTGTRSEFGLLRPVMHAVRAHPGLELLVVAAGAHLIPPAETYREVKREFGADLADAVPMQVAGRTGRIADAEALGAGVSRFARCFERLRPDWVVVLGDRIEALAAASAASVAGFAVAHIHGGDRAEGVADEAMRHAITKLAHLHLAATEQSAERIRRMGERADLVHVVGSPAIDGLDRVEALDDARYEELGRPACVFLMHPIGAPAEREEAAAAAALEGVRRVFGGQVLALHPNFDPGREGVLRAVERAGVRVRDHLGRPVLLALLKRLGLGSPPGVLAGNSSAGLIECAALGCPAVNIGPRQGGREHGGNVVHAGGEGAAEVEAAVREARRMPVRGLPHPFGDGRAGERIAAILARTDGRSAGLVRKRCVY